jgi:hypothetical protein
MYKKYVPAIAGAAALSICSAGGTFAQTAAGGITYNTDLKLTRQSTITIIDQQSPYPNSGDPDFDRNGNEETIDITSLDLDLFFSYGNFKSVLRQDIAAGGTLNISVEPAGFCAAISTNGSSGNSSPTQNLLGRADESEPFIIPLSQLRQGPSFGPLLSTYLFEGQAETFFDIYYGYYGAPSYGATAANAAGGVLYASAAEAPIPPADSQEGYEGVPFANMSLTLTALNLGELKLDGITDVSEVLGVPQGKVDVLLSVGAGPSVPGEFLNTPDGIGVATPAPVDASCLPSVTPTIVIVPAASEIGILEQQ